MLAKSKVMIVCVGVLAILAPAIVLVSQKSIVGTTPKVTQVLPKASISGVGDSSQVTPPEIRSNLSPGRRSSAGNRDDWERASEWLVAAKAGNRDAQYHLFAVIDDCTMLLDYYFTQDGTPLTLDEGLKKTVNASQLHQAEESFDHCHRFREHNIALELGSAEHWLDAATKNGQPLAEAVTARRQLDQDAQDTAVPLGSSKNGGLSFTIPSGAQPDRRAVDLLRSAVQSLEPSVLEIIGDEQTALHGSRMSETVDRYAWIYVACQRGLDCSATSHYAIDCPQGCDTSTPETILMAWSGDEWSAVQQRAAEIRAKLGASKWNELGLGP